MLYEMTKSSTHPPPPNLVHEYDVEPIVELGASDATDEMGVVGVRKSARIGARKSGDEEEVEDWEMSSLSELVGKGRLTLRNDQKKVNLAPKRKMILVSEVLEKEKSRRFETSTGEKRSHSVTSKKVDSKLGKSGFGKELEVKKLQISSRKRGRGEEKEEVETLETDERIHGRIGEEVEDDGEEVEELTLAEMKMMELEVKMLQNSSRNRGRGEEEEEVEILETDDRIHGRIGEDVEEDGEEVEELTLAEMTMKELAVGKFHSSCRKRGRGLVEEQVQMLKNDKRQGGRLGEVVVEVDDEVEELTLAEMKTKALRNSKARKDYGKRKMSTTQEVGVQEEVVLNKNRRIYPECEDLEVMAVEDSEFYDFDKDRVERSFKKGQVWAVYDDDDGMPRHYGLIDEVDSVNPFEIKMSWLDFQNDGEETLTSWEKRGFHVSCGKFKVARKDNVKLLNIFSHLVGCERVARDLYLIYPRKGSIWALYYERTLDSEGRTSPSTDQRGYDIVLFLSSYSPSHGLSMAYLDKVDGYKAVFTRREIGYSAVRWVEKIDNRLFSHQIPARKLSGDEAPQLSGDYWELDPASLPRDLLALAP